MSGGSWNYFYSQLETVAERLQRDSDPLRRAFGYHLTKCAKALHDIEWVDSGDCGPGSERKAIEAALGKDAIALELEQARLELEATIEKARRVCEQLETKRE